MTDEVQSSLQKLRKTVPQLNKISDEAAAVVQRIETLLRDKWSIGVAGEAQYDYRETASREGDDMEAVSVVEIRSLVFDRIGPQFRIGVETYVQTCADEPRLLKCLSSDTVAWDQCDRGTKLASFAVLPKLLANIAKNAESATEEAEKASKALGELLTALSAEK